MVYVWWWGDVLLGRGGAWVAGGTGRFPAGHRTLGLWIKHLVECPSTLVVYSMHKGLLLKQNAQTGGCSCSQAYGNCHPTSFWLNIDNMPYHSGMLGLEHPQQVGFKADNAKCMLPLCSSVWLFPFVMAIHACTQPSGTAFA